MNVRSIAVILVISGAAVCALAQEPSAVDLKADTQNVVKIISSDKAKVQAYCDAVKLGEQMDQAEQSNDSKTSEELFKKLDELSQKLGPEYAALMERLQDLDPNSAVGLEISSTLATLDKFCNQ
jgi:predicted transcriptional regulator